MPWYAKYDGLKGSSHSDGSHALHDLVVPTCQNHDQAATFTAIALAESGGQQTDIFQPGLTSEPTGPVPILDSSAVATLHNLDFDL